MRKHRYLSGYTPKNSHKRDAFHGRLWAGKASCREAHARSEKIRVALAFPVRHMAQVFHPFQAFESGEFGDECLA